MYWIRNAGQVGVGVIAEPTVAEGIFNCLTSLSLLSAETSGSFWGLHQSSGIKDDFLRFFSLNSIVAKSGANRNVPRSRHRAGLGGSVLPDRVYT